MEKEPYVTVYAKAFLEMSPESNENNQKLFEWFCKKAEEEGHEASASRQQEKRTSHQVMDSAGG